MWQGGVQLIIFFALRKDNLIKKEKLKDHISEKHLKLIKSKAFRESFDKTFMLEMILTDLDVKDFSFEMET